MKETNRFSKPRLNSDTRGVADVVSTPVSAPELDGFRTQTAPSGRDTMGKRLRHLMKTMVPPVLVLVLFLALWELGSRLFAIKEYVLPAPSRITSAIAATWLDLMRDASVTMAEALLGFFVANVLSIFVAIAFSHSAWLERSFYPYVIALKSIPIVAIAPLLVIWFGYGFVGKIVMAATISFFPLVVNATIGLKNVDANALDLMRSLSASKWQILMMLRFPNALPYMFSALKISSALAVMGAIVAEMTGATAGLGYTIMVASYNIDTPLLFAAVVVASLCGIGFFGCVTFIESVAAKKFMFVPRRDAT